MKTSDRVQQLLKLPVNQAPAPAVQLVQFLCKKYGTCGEIYVAAYEAYAIVCEQTEGGMCDEESRRFLTTIKTDAKQSDKRPTTLPTIHLNGTGAAQHAHITGPSEAGIKAAELEWARTAPGMRSDSFDRILALQDQIRDGALSLADAVKEIGAPAPAPSPPPPTLVDRVANAIYNVPFDSDAEARAAIREVAAWLRSEYPRREGYGTAWANLIDDRANQ